MCEVLGFPNSLVRDGKFVDNIKILDHVAELRERDLAIKVLVSLDDRAVNELLELSVVEVVANHHLEHLEQLTV